MSLLSVGENKWRMLRRVVRKKTFTFADARNMSRYDRVQFDWLVAHGFFTPVRHGVYELTELGRAAADLGEYDWEPTAGGSPPSARER
jgi:hypothetical protein